MSDCGRYVKKSSYNGLPNSYFCMKKGIKVGNHIKLPLGYSPMDDTLQYKNERCDSGSKGSPYLCFKKGFAIGKKNQYEKNKYKMKEDFTEFSPQRVRYFSGDNENSVSGFMLFIAILIGFITFGLFLTFEIYWLWAIIIGIVSSSLFLYFCNCQS